jgi:integrase
MARRSTGGVLARRRGRATFYAIRFRAFGRRQYVTLGSSEEGWTRAKAEEELQNVLADARRGLWAPRRRETPVEEPRPEPTFHEFASEWFQARRAEWRSATQSDYEWQLTSHLLPAFARHRLSEITVEEVDRYRAIKVRQGALSPTSINKTLTRLAQILEVAVEYGYIERNPARGRRRRLRASPPRRTWLDRADQIESLLDGAARLDAGARANRGIRRAMLATLLFAGLRLGEMLALRWRDVDLATGHITVTDSKTDAGMREVELQPALRDELATYKAGCATTRPESLLFSTGTGKRWGQSNVRNRVLAKSIEKANEKRAEDELAPLPEGLTPHSMRRTFASVLYALGFSPVDVMDQLGHTDPKLALSIYAKSMRRSEGERERLRALLGGDAVVTPGGLPVGDAQNGTRTSTGYGPA